MVAFGTPSVTLLYTDGIDQTCLNATGGVTNFEISQPSIGRITGSQSRREQVIDPGRKLIITRPGVASRPIVKMAGGI